MQLEWPGNSPDINPIENLWAYLKTRIRKKTNLNVTVLIKNILSVWENEVEASYILILVHSMPKRIKMVIEAKDAAIKN